MKYKDIKIIEDDFNEIPLGSSARVNTICRTLRRAAANASWDKGALGNAKWLLNKHLEQYPEDREGVLQCANAAGIGDGIGNGQGNGIGNGQGDGIGNGRGDGQGDGQGNGQGDGQGDGQGTGQGNIQGNSQGTGTGANQGDGTAANAANVRRLANELETRINNEDWVGARRLIRQNPELQGVVPQSVVNDLDAAITAAITGQPLPEPETTPETVPQATERPKVEPTQSTREPSTSDDDTLSVGDVLGNIADKIGSVFSGSGETGQSSTKPAEAPNQDVIKW